MADARVSAGGAVLSAFGAAASWLCCLPFALGALGTTGSFLSHFLGPLRPYITAFSVVLLGVAFYQAYRLEPAGSCALDGDCSNELNVARRQRFLWMAAGLSLILITVPYWLNWVIFWTL